MCHVCLPVSTLWAHLPLALLAIFGAWCSGRCGGPRQAAFFNMDDLACHLQAVCDPTRRKLWGPSPTQSAASPCRGGKRHPDASLTNKQTALPKWKCVAIRMPCMVRSSCVLQHLRGWGAERRFFTMPSAVTAEITCANTEGQGQVQRKTWTSLAPNNISTMKPC